MNSWQAGQDRRVGQETEDRRQETEDRRQKTGDRRQETEERRGNPDVVGMGVLVVASFSISRILYLLDVYYTGWTVRCQVNFNHRFHRFSQIFADFRRFNRFGPRRHQGTRGEGRGTKGERGQWGI
jgi:hypothetical protein